MVVLMLVVELIVLGIVLSGARDHTLTVHRVETTRAFYGTEAAVNMALREVYLNFDEDGDGGVGSISDDGDDMNDPTIGPAAFRVTRTDGGGSGTLEAISRAGTANRNATSSFTLTEADVPMEIGTVIADGTPQTIHLVKKYTTPVVICSVNNVANGIPIVTRVGNVTSTSFDLYLQNPSGLLPAPDAVSYIVMEQGFHTINGVKCEAIRHDATTTARNNNWIADNIGYLQAYANPVVLGQVMTTNDAFWSVFWCRGTGTQNPPNPANLRVNKTVCEDTTVARAAETLGVIVFEDGSGTIAGVAMDAQEGADNVQGVSNSPPYALPFNNPFTTTPAVVIVGQHAMDGNNGGWPVLWGVPHATSTQANVVCDEDQIGDAERSHTSEQLVVVAFETLLPQPEVETWTEVEP